MVSGKMSLLTKCMRIFSSCIHSVGPLLSALYQAVITPVCHGGFHGRCPYATSCVLIVSVISTFPPCLAYQFAMWLGPTVLVQQLSPTPLRPQVYCQPQPHKSLNIVSLWLPMLLYKCLDFHGLSWSSRNWSCPPQLDLLPMRDDALGGGFTSAWTSERTQGLAIACQLFVNHVRRPCSIVLWKTKFRVPSFLIKYIPAKTGAVVSGQ